MNSRSIAAVLWFLATLAATAAPRFAQSAHSVDRFDFVEVTLTLEAPVKGNPFLEAALEGQFTPGGGSVARVRYNPCTGQSAKLGNTSGGTAWTTPAVTDTENRLFTLEVQR